jgi:hypothetical protein
MYRLCRHTMPTGRLCQSPAAGASAFCFHHTRTRRRRPVQAEKLDPATLRPETIDYLRFYCTQAVSSLAAPPSGPRATQIALAAVFNGMAGGDIPLRDGRRLLNALSLVVRLGLNDSPARS